MAVGVQRAQISKLENNTSNVTIGTIMKVFDALKATLNFRIENEKLYQHKMNEISVSIVNHQSFCWLANLDAIIRCFTLGKK